MKKLFLIIYLSLLSSINIVTANTDIAIIDMERIITLSKPGASILKQLTELNKKNIEYIKSEEKKIKEKEIKIISQKNILSDIEFKSSVDKLRLEISSHNKKKNKIISDFNLLKSTNTGKFFKLINPILTKYSEEKSISVIFRKKNIVIGKTQLDISDEIITIINKDIKNFKIK